MSRSGGKNYGKHYMTGCDVSTFVKLKCTNPKCKNTLEGHYGRIPKTCRKCGGELIEQKRS